MKEGAPEIAESDTNRLLRELGDLYKEREMIPKEEFSKEKHYRRAVGEKQKKINDIVIELKKSGFKNWEEIEKAIDKPVGGTEKEE